MLLQHIKVLIMDELTNHLDIKSKNVLKKALQQFEGTLILVSHDRDFLQGLTNKVYEFRNKKIKEYLGDINFYLEQRKVDDFREIEKKDKVEKTNSKGNKNKDIYNEQKKSKKLTNRLSKVESQTAELEKETADADVALANDYEKTTSRPHFFDNY